MKHLFYLAQNFDVDKGSGLLDPRQYNDAPASTLPQTVIQSIIIKILWPVISVGAVLSLVYGGVLYVTAGGDPEKTERGKRVIIYSVVAIVVTSAIVLIYRAVIKGVESGTV